MRFRSIILVLCLFLTNVHEASAQWVQTNGPWGADFDPSTSNAFASIDSDLFVATYEGVFVSTDTGITWSNRSKGLPNLPLKAVASMGTMLFAAGDSNIFMSSDQGISWTKTTWEFGGIGSIYVHDSTIYGAGDSLYRSTDFGLTWAASGLPISEYHPFGLLFCGSNLLLATDYGLDISTDSGQTWKLSDSGMVGTNGMHAGPPFLANGSVYVEIGNVIGSMVVFRSTDCGVSWRATRLVGIDVEGGFAALGDILFAGSSEFNQVFSSSDSGLSWRTHREALGGIQGLASFGGKLFVAKVYNSETGSNVSGFGVYRSDDSAKSWKFSSVGIPKTPIYCLASNGSTLFAGLDGGIRLSSDEGNTWNTPDFLGDRTIFQLAADDSNVVMLVRVDSTFSFENAYYSEDNGQTFKPSSGLPSDYLYCLTNIDSTFFVGTSNGLYISSDHGKSWSPARDSGESFYVVLSLVSFGHNLFACTYDRNGIWMGIIESTDMGSTWEGSDTAANGQAVEAVFEAGGLLFGDNNYYGTPRTNFNAGVVRSTDSGLTWTSTGLKDSTYLGPIVAIGSRLVASIGMSQTANISVSNDSGLTWNSVSDGLGIDSMNITSLCVHNNFVFAGTWNDGVWRRPLSDFGISSVSPQPAARAETLTAYPNPATHSITLHFTAAESGYATITIVNALGAEVARIYSGELSAGEHSFQWDSSRFAPGMYECVVRMNGTVRDVPVLLE